MGQHRGRFPTHQFVRFGGEIPILIEAMADQFHFPTRCLRSHDLGDGAATQEIAAERVKLEGYIIVVLVRQTEIVRDLDVFAGGGDDLSHVLSGNSPASP